MTTDKLSDEAAQFYDRVKAGERIEWHNGPDYLPEIDELCHAGLIETQALVWETRVCYVLTGTDPRRDAVVRVIQEALGPGYGSSAEELADEILAVLK
jgi:hypothetical protein